MYDSAVKVHEKDTKNLRKHRKMNSRVARGVPIIHKSKWARKHGAPLEAKYKKGKPIEVKEEKVEEDGN